MNIVDRFLAESVDSSITKNGRRQSVKVFIIKDNKILFLRIQEGCSGAGKWDLPGGGIEDNENQKDAVIRKVDEETSLKITNIKRLQEKTGKLDIPQNGTHNDWIFYIADAVNSDVNMKPSHCSCMHGRPEHNEYKWVDEEWQLDQMEMDDSFKRIARKLFRKFNKNNPTNKNKN